MPVINWPEEQIPAVIEAIRRGLRPIQGPGVRDDFAAVTIEPSIIETGSPGFLADDGELFLVLVEEDGTGSAGDDTTQCSFVYNVYTTELQAANRTLLGSSVAQYKQRPSIGKMVAPADFSFALAFYDNATTPVLWIWDAGETFSVEAC